MPGTVLALETATDVCSVALAQEDRVVAEVRLWRPRAHAERLVPMIEHVLGHARQNRAEIDVVAVSSGPGSYTGLRIGTSTAKGLAWAMDARFVAVPSLEAQAAAALPVAAPGDLICAAFRARRREVFAATFQKTDGGSLRTLLDTAALADDAVPSWLSSVAARRLWLVGDGASDAAASLHASPHEVYLLDDQAYSPSAVWVARQARPRMSAGRFEDVSAFEPFYLNPFVAKKPQGSIFQKLPF